MKKLIILFNSPFSKNVKTNVGCKFLCLIDKHFPRTKKLHKIFNRNNVKVSCTTPTYSQKQNRTARRPKINATAEERKNVRFLKIA